MSFTHYKYRFTVGFTQYRYSKSFTQYKYKYTVSFTNEFQSGRRTMFYMMPGETGLTTTHIVSGESWCAGAAQSLHSLH